ncbi:hypothetical protein HOY80DRAFT_1141897 [Tuber brumale]|nr:hypothetical protein HOY80DRAFT_1141897 [Tuber brumale]
MEELRQVPTGTGVKPNAIAFTLLCRQYTVLATIRLAICICGYLVLPRSFLIYACKQHMRPLEEEVQSEVEEVKVDKDKPIPLDYKSEGEGVAKLGGGRGRRIVVKKPLLFTHLSTRTRSPGTHLSTPYTLARHRLHGFTQPPSLPYHEAEFTEVYTHLSAATAEGTGSCIYISGTPRTGNTTTYLVTLEELDDFTFVEINGMKVKDPHQAYSLLWEAIQGDLVSPSQALRLLDSGSALPVLEGFLVVLMDELDQLVLPGSHFLATPLAFAIDDDHLIAPEQEGDQQAPPSLSRRKGGGDSSPSCGGSGLNAGGRETIAIVQQAIQATSSPLQIRRCGVGEDVLHDDLDETERVVRM